MNEPARRLIHGQAAETMPEERIRPIQGITHLGHQRADELVDVGDRLFVDAAETSGRLDRHDFDGGIQRLSPTVIYCRSSAGERKTEQADTRRGARAGADEPAPDSS